MTRDEHGRFIKGVTGNPKGRKPKEISENITKLLDRVVSEQDWLDIFDVALKQAKRGDDRARDFLTERRFGKVIQENKNENTTTLKIEGLSDLMVKVYGYSKPDQP